MDFLKKFLTKRNVVTATGIGLTLVSIFAPPAAPVIATIVAVLGGAGIALPFTPVALQKK